MEMTKDDYKREAQYQVSMRAFQKWLKSGLITKEEYTIIDTKMKEKYRPRIGSLCSGIELI